MAGLINGNQFGSTFPAVLPRMEEQLHGFEGAEAKSQASLIQATYTSIYEVGCLFGALGALIFGDWMGRKRMMYLGAFVMTVGTIIQVTAFDGHKAPEQFCVGRVITGIGNGLNTSTIPSWQAETSKSHNRGVLVCIEASMIAIGTVISYWIDFGFYFNCPDGRTPTCNTEDATWRFPIGKF